MDGARILERRNFRYTRTTQEHAPFLFGVCVLYAYAPSAYHWWDSRINRKSVTVARKSKPIHTTPAALVARVSCACVHTTIVLNSLLQAMESWWLTGGGWNKHRTRNLHTNFRTLQKCTVDVNILAWIHQQSVLRTLQCIHPQVSTVGCEKMYLRKYIIIYMCMYLHRLRTYICSRKYTSWFFFLSPLKNWNWNWIHMYIYTHMHVSICIQPDWRTLLFINSCELLCLYVYVFIYIHTYVSTHTRYTYVCI